MANTEKKIWTKWASSEIDIFSYIFMRSTWEVAVGKYLDAQNIHWKYEYKRYKLNDRLTYVPDFFIFSGNNIVRIIEVKGWEQNKDRRKARLFRKMYTIPLEIWKKKKLRSLKLIDCNGYGKW